MRMTNRWNRIIYRLWAPIYDATVNHIFLPGRHRALEVLALQPGERVLIVGIGTGADLPLLPEGIHVTGIDLSSEMLTQARRKLPLLGCETTLIEGDAQVLLVEAQTYDAAILNLILSVIPDGTACLDAARQALKAGGRAVIFDKFVSDANSPSVIRRFLNIFSTFLGTDINRRLEDMFRSSDWHVVSDEPSIMHGTYRVVLLEKTL
jgi:phosphatidylethanolamine/phosphatidyl-N-methylethanolamine N-methyltransferase